MSITKLNDAKSKDELLDKFTLKYIDELDIEGAKKQLKAEIECRKSFSKVVRQHYPNAVKATIEDIISDCKTARSKTLFVNSNFSIWNYDETDTNTFKNRILEIRKNGANFNVVGDCQSIPLPIYHILQSIKDWSGNICNASVELGDGLYPVAIIVNPAKRNVLDLKNETCKNREKRNVLKISHTRHFKTIKAVQNGLLLQFLNNK